MVRGCLAARRLIKRATKIDQEDDIVGSKCGHLFVYGTLRTSRVPPKLEAIVTPLLRLGSATTVGSLYDLGPYPGAIFGGEGQIVGDVLELSDDPHVLAALDDYEGFLSHDPQGSLYVRVRLMVTLAEGRQLDCWAYAYNRDVSGFPRIPGGDYLARDDR